MLKVTLNDNKQKKNTYITYQCSSEWKMVEDPLLREFYIVPLNWQV